MTTQVDITNMALAQIGTRSQITSFADGSAEGLYAGLLYAPLLEFMLREGDYDWAMTMAATVPVTGVGLPWVFVYAYPAAAIRIRMALPPSPVQYDPAPIEWNVASSGASRYIVSKSAIATIGYTFAAPEDSWDAMFQEAYVRMLGSVLAFSLENRIEASKIKLEEALSFAGIANLRDS